MYEHSAFYLPPILVCSANLGSGWNQAVVTCSSNKAPILYINGKKVRTALGSGRKKAFYGLITGGGLAGGSYGNYKGSIDDLKAWNRALSDDEVSQLYAAESSQTNMVTVQGAPTIKTFQIGKYEVTWAEWRAVLLWGKAHGYWANPLEWVNDGSGLDGDLPASYIPWIDAVKFCNAKSEIEGLTPVYTYNSAVYRNQGGGRPIVNGTANGYRLPYKSEAERAARGGNLSKGFLYSGSNSINEVAWYIDGVIKKSQPVGKKMPNELGIYDLSGNVAEWLQDIGGSTQSENYYYGGSFLSTSDFCKIGVYQAVVAAYDIPYVNIGFRLARSSLD
jgi:formylglycine-generating enzyme required for sulfatase activity